jgi:hypothetical protein
MIGNVFAILAALLSILALGLVSGWASQNGPSPGTFQTNGWLTRPSWGLDSAYGLHKFSWHPVLMVAGFFLAQAYTLITWCFTPELGKVAARGVIWFFRAAALACFIAAMCAVVNFSLLNRADALVSLHSWIGVCSFIVFGCSFLWGFVVDKELARKALRDVVGKGFFHNSTPKNTASSIFSFDTGPDWTLRRTTFRKAFSTVCLKAHMSTITQLSGRMVRHLEKTISETRNGDCTVRIDDIFLQLTIGVICEVAFEMNVNAFEESSDYGKHMDGILKELFKVTQQSCVIANDLQCDNNASLVEKLGEPAAVCYLSVSRTH